METIIDVYKFITSMYFSQYIYFITALEFIILGIDRSYESYLMKKGLRIESPYGILSTCDFICALALGGAFIANGSNPKIERDNIVAFVRLVWLLLTFVMGYAACLKTYRVFTLMAEHRIDRDSKELL